MLAQDGASPNKIEPQHMREKSVPSVFKWQLLEKFRNDSHNITFEYLLVCFMINIYYYYYYCLCVSVLVNAMYVQMPREARRGHCISWNWSVSCARVVGMELGSYGNAASVLNGRAMSPAQGLLLANEKGRRGPALCCRHLSLKHPFRSPPNWKVGLYYVLRRLFYELTAERSRSDSYGKHSYSHWILKQGTCKHMKDQAASLYQHFPTLQNHQPRAQNHLITGRVTSSGILSNKKIRFICFYFYVY